MFQFLNENLVGTTTLSVNSTCETDHQKNWFGVRFRQKYQVIIYSAISTEKTHDD